MRILYEAFKIKVLLFNDSYSQLCWSLCYDLNVSGPTQIIGGSLNTMLIISGDEVYVISSYHVVSAITNNMNAFMSSCSSIMPGNL